MGKFNILFIKTAKCATETIRVHLIEYAREVGLKINDKNYEEFFSEPLFNINTNHIWSDYRSLTHFYNSIDKKLPTIKISSVRSPLERLYSHYCYGHPYFIKGMDFNEWYIKTIKGEIQDRWPAEHWGDKTNNYMSDYMGIESLDKIMEQYDFIFIKEDFENSLLKLESTLEYKFQKKDKKINKNPKSKKDYKFDSETIDLFNEYNQKDIELYNYVLKNY